MQISKCINSVVEQRLMEVHKPSFPVSVVEVIRYNVNTLNFEIHKSCILAPRYRYDDPTPS